MTGLLGAGLIGGIANGIAGFFNASASNTLLEGQKNAQKYMLAGQKRVAAAQKSVLASKKITQEAANRQALENAGRELSAASAAYRKTQGANVAQMGAANVEMSSGSAARTLEGNALSYAADEALLRYNERLVNWQGETALAALDTAMQNADLSIDAYSKQAAIVDSVSGTSPWASALAGFGKSFGMSLMQYGIAGAGKSEGATDPKRQDYDAMASSGWRMTGSQWDSLLKAYGY